MAAKRQLFIAVMLLLSAIVVVVIWKSNVSRERKQLSELCASDLHDLWFTLRWYADAHGGVLPSASGEAWVRQTSRFIKNRAELKCPLDKGNGVTSYILVPEAAGKRLDNMTNKVILRENRPRHSGSAHGLLGSGIVIKLKETK